MMVLDAKERECTFSTLLRIDNFESYNFKGEPGHVHYVICAYVVELGFDEVTGNPVPDGQGGQAYTIFKYPMQSGSIELTDAVVVSGVRMTRLSLIMLPNNYNLLW